jgi:ubiquitin fusion degradation protein 1
MLFKLINGAEKKHSHAGVLEFIAEEGRVYLPQWVIFVNQFTSQHAH